MKLCFIADFRSTIARSWIGYFTRLCRVQVLSTAPSSAMDGVDLHNLAAGAGKASPEGKRRWARFLDHGHWSGRALLAAHDHLWLPARAARLAPAIGELVQRLQPDIVHSLRIPIEAEAAGLALEGRPHLISAWGNDFTLFASRSPAHAWLTKRALRGCAGFLADSRADVDRARLFGLAPEVPTLVVPGAGGVDMAVFRTAAGPPSWAGALAPLQHLAPSVRLVVNARGFRGYVRNDSFLRAAAAVAAKRPDVFFVGVGLAGWPPAEDLVRELGLAGRTLLTGPLNQQQLAELHRHSAMMVSPTEHDGTPNTLLEAMACGALPVCGDLPSIREWIDHGDNGLLCRVDRPEPLGEAMLAGLDDPALALRARQKNPGIVAARAEYGSSLLRAAEFYERVLQTRRRAAPSGLLHHTEVRS